MEIEESTLHFIEGLVTKTRSYHEIEGRVIATHTAPICRTVSDNSYHIYLIPLSVKSVLGKEKETGGKTARNEKAAAAESKSLCRCRPEEKPAVGMTKMHCRVLNGGFLFWRARRTHIACYVI